MNVWKLVFQEIRFRMLGFVLACIAVGAAIACLVASMTLLDVHDRATQAILAAKEADTKTHMAKLQDEMRVAMLKLGLNLVVLPKQQDVTNWYADHSLATTMDEADAQKLTRSEILTIRHILPILQQPITWPETKRKIILVGTRGETTDLHKNPKKPIVQPVLKDTIVLGYELHQSLGLEVGDQVQLMGKTFTVHNCHQERGTKDDITAWIQLSQAQELLEKPEKINAILALQCLCKGPDLSYVREDIASILPHTQVLELGAQRRLARAEARASVGREVKAALNREKELRATMRDQRQRSAAILVGIVLIAAGVWVWFLALINVRHRRTEIGILRALGYGSGKILALFMSKALLVGLAGGVAGWIIGTLVGRTVALSMEETAATVLPATLWNPWAIGLALLAAPLLSALASWVPSIQAVLQDPADVLRKE